MIDLDTLLVVKYLIILPIITGFGMAFKEVDDKYVDNQFIPFILALLIGVPLAMLIKYMPELAEPTTQGLLMSFVGVFGHKVFKYITNNNNTKKE